MWILIGYNKNGHFEIYADLQDSKDAASKVQSWFHDFFTLPKTNMT